MRAQSVIAAAAVAVVIAASSCPTSSADPTSDGPPFPIGQMGVPLHARAAGGATADITVNSATWLPPGCTSHFANPTNGSACNVVELTITATSHRFFQFDQRYIFAGYGGGNQPWTHPDDAPQPATLAVDYQRLDKMPPLQAGGLHDGQTAHGFVGFAMPTAGDLYITINDPEQLAPYTEAGWIVHT
ncbi:hypothetical protein A5791_05640 [Mycobacterium sp. 852002-51163_SCH5372311]|uniref:hypothetical protein n=1 Tax=Mycobacterium sp. 852002-51163_SCH5372311 TaxID=1834097 RepID=UPI0008011964|nr:hypothetical protein [Mycobacterium sp. 852002-51163_SCH5372311]OBF81134.1 hypothetical protein A5791_05640 [Mycobacterium sp. 852002-51163_SCH5372311]